MTISLFQNHSEMYRNEYLEKMYEDCKKKKKKNLEKSIAPVTKDEPVEEKKEDPKTVRAEVVEPVRAEVVEPEILKEKTATKKRERRKKNAMLNALQDRMKTSLSDDSKSLSQYSTDVNKKKESVVKPLPEKSRESPAVTDRLTALLLGKDLEEYRDSKSSESSSADLKSVNRYSIDANEKKSVVKPLPETTQESIDVTDRFAALFRGKDVEEYCDAKSSVSSSATYYSAHSDLSEQGDGDISVKDVKHKKKTHTTSQRRQNRTVLSLASATKAPPKPFVYVSPSKGHSSLDLSSKSEFPRL